MQVLKMVATEQLKVLVAELIVGNAFRLVSASPDNTCGRDLYVRILLSHGSLTLLSCAASMLLFSMMMTTDTDAVASAEVAVRRKRRVVLLIAICLSAACSVLAVSTFEDGLHYRNGCAATTEVGWLLLGLVVLIGLVLPAHGYLGWVTVFEH